MTYCPPSCPLGITIFIAMQQPVELTAEGVDSPVTRLLERGPRKIMTRAGRSSPISRITKIRETPKTRSCLFWCPMNAERRKLPLLCRRELRTRAHSISGYRRHWRWQMSEALGDPSHDLFWQQLLRWLVAQSPGPVTAQMPVRVVDGPGTR